MCFVKLVENTDAIFSSHIFIRIEGAQWALFNQLDYFSRNGQLIQPLFREHL